MVDAKLVIGTSGTQLIGELAYLGIPAILVPEQGQTEHVITSYSIHYTKLYDPFHSCSVMFFLIIGPTKSTFLCDLFLTRTGLETMVWLQFGTINALTNAKGLDK